MANDNDCKQTTDDKYNNQYGQWKKTTLTPRNRSIERSCGQRTADKFDMFEHPCELSLEGLTSGALRKNRIFQQQLAFSARLSKLCPNRLKCAL